MSEVNEERVLDALKGIIEPGLGKDIVSLGMVESIKAKCLLWVTLRPSQRQPTIVRSLG